MAPGKSFKEITSAYLKGAERELTLPGRKEPARAEAWQGEMAPCAQDASQAAVRNGGRTEPGRVSRCPEYHSREQSGDFGGIYQETQVGEGWSMPEFYKIPSSGGGRWIDRVARTRAEERGDRERGREDGQGYGGAWSGGRQEIGCLPAGDVFGRGAVVDSVI